MKWIISLCLAITFIGFALISGKKGVDNQGKLLRYPLGKGMKRLRKIGMSITAMLLIGTLLVPAILPDGGLENILSIFAAAQGSDDADNPDIAGGDGAASQANAGTTQQAQEVEVAIDDVVHPGLDLSQEELDVLTAGLEFYVGRQSMTSWLPIRNELCGFQNAVSIPLTLMFLDYDYVEELHGRSRTNPDLKALPTADVLKAIREKLEEWQKEFADLPDDEKNQAMKEAIKQEIATNVIFADMVLRFYCTQKYYVTNNEWLLEGKDMLDQAYQEPNGLWSLCQYEEGFDENSDCASAHIVYRNDIMERKINSVKAAEEQAAEDQAKADGTTTSDGDGAINSSTDDQQETEYYSFGYTTLVQMLIALIDDTTPVGICKGMTTVENYYLVEAANPSFTRTALSPYQESEDVFLLQVIDKSGRIVLSYGFNTRDRRVGLYDRTDKPVEVVRDSNLEVRYLEEGTNNKVAEPNFEYRVPGTKLDDVKPVKVTDFTCINPDEAKGKIMPDGDLVITFYYRKDQSKPQTYLLTVVCQNEADGKEFTNFSLGRHQKNEVVTIPHNNYDGWVFVSGPSTHTMPGKDDTVVLIYRQKTGGDPDPTPTPDPDPTPTPTPPGDGDGGKTPTAGTSQNGEGDKGGGDSAANNGGSDDGSYQNYDKEKEEADRIAKEQEEAEKRRQEEEAERQRQEEERRRQEEEARQKELENAQNQGQGDGLTTENGNDPDVSEEIPIPDTDWTETSTNPDGSSTSTTTNAATGEQTTQTTQTDQSGNTTTESSSGQQDPNHDTTGEIDEPPAD